MTVVVGVGNRGRGCGGGGVAVAVIVLVIVPVHRGVVVAVLMIVTAASHLAPLSGRAGAAIPLVPRLRYAAPVLVLFALACAPPVEVEETPATLESQSLLATQRFYEDDEGEQIAQLIEFLADARTGDPVGFYFAALTPDDVDMFDHSDDAIWEHTAGCGVLADLRGAVPDYAAVVPEPDQSFPDPSYAVWTRELTGGSGDAFLGGDDLQTWNHIEKAGFGFDVAYDMEKDYRWFGDTLAMISLVPEGHLPVDALDTQLVVGFTLELWTPIDGTMVWYNASWTEIESPLDEDKVDMEWWLDQLIAGTLDYYWGTEEHVTGTPHEE